MTIYEMKIVMHYYACGDDPPEVKQRAPILDSTLRELVIAGLLRPLVEPNRHGATYVATDAARVYVEALQAVPLPVQRWVMPGAHAGDCR